MAGFKLNRPNGTVAIDANYFNLALRQKGSLVLSNVPNASTPAFKNGGITVAGDQAIIAFRSDRPCALFEARRNGGTYSYVFAGQNANGNINVDWWLFDLPQYALQFATSGKMIVRRPGDGAVVFDSRNKYMKLLDFVQYASQVYARNSYPKTPAIIMNNRAWSQTAAAINGGNNTLVQMTSSMAYTEGNAVLFGGEITSLSIQDSQAPKFSYSGGKADFLVIDVQDY